MSDLNDLIRTKIDYEEGAASRDAEVAELRASIDALQVALDEMRAERDAERDAHRITAHVLMQAEHDRDQARRELDAAREMVREVHVTMAADGYEHMGDVLRALGDILRALGGDS